MPPHTAELSVSQLLKILEGYKTSYFETGEIPALDTAFKRNLFNTFFCYIDHVNFFPFHLKLHTDERGSFVETVKMNSGGQISFSTTLPGIIRGNHFHTRKAERFAVIKGKARIDMRRIGTDNILSFIWTEAGPRLWICPSGLPTTSPTLAMKSFIPFSGLVNISTRTDPDTFFEKV